MRQLIMWNLVSLDGYFEGPKKWDLDFLNLAWGDELEQLSIDQTGSAGVLVFGRATYEGMAAWWPSAEGTVADIMNAIPKVVFSRTLERADWNNTRLVKDDAVAEVRRLKAEPGADIFIFGSAELSASLIAQDLIDEFRICVVPVLIGKGTPLFQSTTPKSLTHAGTRDLDSGATILTYRLARSKAH